MSLLNLLYLSILLPLITAAPSKFIAEKGCTLRSYLGNDGMKGYALDTCMMSEDGRYYKMVKGGVVRRDYAGHTFDTIYLNYVYYTTSSCTGRSVEIIPKDFAPVRCSDDSMAVGLVSYGFYFDDFNGGMNGAIILMKYESSACTTPYAFDYYPRAKCFGTFRKAESINANDSIIYSYSGYGCSGEPYPWLTLSTTGCSPYRDYTLNERYFVRALQYPRGIKPTHRPATSAPGRPSATPSKRPVAIPSVKPVTRKPTSIPPLKPSSPSVEPSGAGTVDPTISPSIPEGSDSGNLKLNLASSSNNPFENKTIGMVLIVIVVMACFCPFIIYILYRRNRGTGKADKLLYIHESLADIGEVLPDEGDVVEFLARADQSNYGFHHPTVKRRSTLFSI